MIEFINAKCPNCGADIEVSTLLNEYICNYCGSKLVIENNTFRVVKKHTIEKDEIDKKCEEISEKFNSILENYSGSKDEMLLMLKEKVGLVSSGKTLAKLEMMKTSQSYVEEKFDEPFVYRIGDRTLDHFEYKRDGSIELTYEAEGDGFFAIEYYGKVTKYNDLNELENVLEQILNEIKGRN